MLYVSLNTYLLNRNIIIKEWNPRGLGFEVFELLLFCHGFFLSVFCLYKIDFTGHWISLASHVSTVISWKVHQLRFNLVVVVIWSYMKLWRHWCLSASHRTLVSFKLIWMKMDVLPPLECSNAFKCHVSCKVIILRLGLRR